MNIQQIQHFLAAGHTTEALEQLQIQAQNLAPQWHQSIILLQASLADLDKQTLNGVISNEEATHRRNRINAAALKLLTYIESGAADPEKVLDELKQHFINPQSGREFENREKNTTRISGSSIQVQGSSEVVIGSGNTFTKKVFNALGKKQFWGIMLAIVVLLAGGTYAWNHLSGGQQQVYASVDEVEGELDKLLEGNAELKSEVNNQKQDLLKAISEGINALKAEKYSEGIFLLEIANAQVQLPSIYKNIALAYQEMGDEKQAEIYFKKAQTVAKPAAPSPTKIPKTEAGAPALHGGKMNLLLSENGGQVMVASIDAWKETIDGKEGRIPYLKSNEPEAVFAFQDERPATFDLFTLLIIETNGYNVSEFELLAGNESPTGSFQSIGKFKTVNAKLMKTPFQEFPFPKVTAKYLKVKLLATHSQSGLEYTHLREFQLWGTLK